MAHPILNWEALDVAKEFARFKQHCMFTFKGPLAEKTELQKVNYLMTYMGDKGREIYGTFAWKAAVQAAEGVEAQPAENDTLDGVFGRFETYVAPQKNEIRATMNFHRRKQQPGEKFDNFVTDLKVLIKPCNYQPLEDRMLRDAIVLRSNEAAVQEKCLDKGEELTLKTAIEIGRNHETAQESMQEISDASQRHVHAVSKTSHKKYNKRNPDQPYLCKKCGRTHKARQCPAFGTKCEKCGRDNHWANCCNSQKNNPARRNNGQRKIHEVGAAEDDTSKSQIEEEFYVEIVDAANDDEWIIPMDINDTLITIKLDTGAQANIIPERDYKKLNKQPKLQPSEVKLKGYTGTEIPVLGSCYLVVKHKDKSAKLHFLVISDGHKTKRYQPVLGLKACNQLHLVKAVWNVEALTSPASYSKMINEEYKDVFEGLGCLPGEHKIQLEKDATPVQNACRKIPFPIREKLKKQLDRMEELEVITKIEEPTEWVHAVLPIVKPDGSLRVCLDPRDLNKAVKREHFKLPSREEMMAQFADAKVFSKLDAYSGFWQIKLDEESSKLCTFITPYARYRFLRLPFGINMAPEAFHRKVHCVFESIDGVDTMMDDIIVWGSTKEEHDNRLRQVLEKARSVNLKMNRNKCQFGVSELTYLGDVVSDAGIKPDPKKSDAIKNMQRPSCKQEVQRFLGMVNYMAKFIPDVSSKTAPLRVLQDGKHEWSWGPEQETAWEELRTILTTSPVLKFYDPEKPTKISADASKDGIGAVLLQQHEDGWAVVAYASKAMTPTEIRYAQIEKECLAMTFACERFNQFVHGMKFEVETDHKPLVAVMKKPLCDCPLRLQRMRIRLQKYDFTLNWTPGKQMFMADTLSRAVDTSEPVTSSMEADIDAYVDMIVTSLPVSTSRMTEIKEETLKDPELIQLATLITDGWPEERRQCPPNCRDYWNYREELSIVEGVLFKGNRIIIPQALRGLMLQKVHEGHQGMEKCKRRAREVMFWPNINSQINDICARCITCLEFAPNHPPEPLQPHNVPEGPWQKVGADIFTLYGKDYLILVDYYSLYIEISMLSSTTSKTIINAMKSVFARHGTPLSLFTDNAPNLVSQEMQRFAEEWDFVHETSSPYYAQSNGQAENAVKTVKSLLKKAGDVNRSLQIYRSTPLACGKSPAELLMNRRIRSNLPISKTLLQPVPVNTQNIREQKQNAKVKQKLYYDQRARSLPELTVHQKVRVKSPHDDHWAKQGTIIKVQGRTYTIKMDDGGITRRNRRHLRRVESSQSNIDNDPDNGDPPPQQQEKPQQSLHLQNNVKPHANQIPPDQRTTRSGRVIKKPDYLKDFISS